ncbi:MAG: glycogen/starch/alpha-glucan phosphorylase [bacterium]|nr:glycogen/starch/alpha-glucan phosphorylase [bacterium]
MERPRITYLSQEQIAISIINDALDQLDSVSGSQEFARVFYIVLSTLNKLDFEADGKILDLYKSSTSLSPQLIDDFIACNLTMRDRDKVLEVILSSCSSAYCDPRYVSKLRDFGYLSVSDHELEEFAKTTADLRKIDTQRRKNQVTVVQESMEGQRTVEPKPVKRTYAAVQQIADSFYGRSIVYISPEMKLIGGPRSIFSGGLGVLAGEYVEGLADLGITTYGITLLYTKSIIQRVSPDGRQTTTEVPIDYSKLPVFDTGVIIAQNVIGVPVRARVWEMQAGSARIFALEDMTSDITEMLYGGEKETPLLREQQNQLLGRGCIKALEHLYEDGIITDKPIIIHLNEANCYCAIDELQQRHLLQDKTQKSRFWNDIGLAFTTHTPVPAGLPMIYSRSFGTDNLLHLAWLLNSDPVTLMCFYVQYPGRKSWDCLDKKLQDRLLDLLKSGKHTEFIAEFKKVAGDNIVLNLTEATAQLADGSTSVSLRHEEVTNSEIILHSSKSPSRHTKKLQPTTGITNGVNIRDWQPTEFQNIDLALLSDVQMHAVKQREKREFIAMVNKRTGSNLSPDHMTISIMRRINTYKRTNLIIKELDALIAELGNQEINIIFSGIPHHKDQPAQQIFHSILEVVKSKHPNIHVAFVGQYDITVAKHAIRGSDVWLMQPVEKKEASSTSHQKALGAATLIGSTYDGAMIENVVDLDINPENANGVFISPLISYRLISKESNRLKFTRIPHTDNGYYDKPFISLDSNEEFQPVAVIEKATEYIIVDAIIDDLSPAHLLTLTKKTPKYLEESPIRKTLENALSADGRLSDTGFHALMHVSLEPFSTSDLHHLYDFNPFPWARLLYKKIGKLVHIHKGLRQGDPDMTILWLRMMRNALARTYEVDIHRMASEYVRDIYDHIKRRKRKNLLEVFPNDDYIALARKWRKDYAEAKQKEYTHHLAYRLTKGFLDPHIGTIVEGIRTSAQTLHNLHPIHNPLHIEVDLKLGWVVQLEDFEVELHYGNNDYVTMELAGSYGTINKRYRFIATVVPLTEGQWKFQAAIKVKNERVVEFMQFCRLNRENTTLEPSVKGAVAEINSLMDTLDVEARKWCHQIVYVNVEDALALPPNVF